MSERLVPRDEVQATIEARRELGAEMERAVIEAFIERIERRLTERADQEERSLKKKRDHQKEMVLGAMGISVPCSPWRPSSRGFRASSWSVP